MISLRHVILVGVLLLGGAAGPALALDDIDTEVAKKHFRKASELYEKGAYEAALLEFRAAQLTKPLPAFRFNIARCLERLERTEEAIAEYEAYIGQPNPPPDAGKVRERISTLRTRVTELARLRAAAAGTNAPVQPPLVPGLRPKEMPGETPPGPTPPGLTAPGPEKPAGPSIPPEQDRGPPQASKPLRQRVVTLSLAGVTGASLVAAIISVSVAAARFSSAKSTCGQDQSCSQEIQDGIRAPANAGYALFAIAGAAAVATVVTYFVEGRAGAAKPAPPVRAWLSPAGAGLSVRF